MTDINVSVCIASYNHAPYLREMLNSVLAQTYKNFEVVVVDDASPDNSLEILNEYAEKFENFRVYTHENQVNKGISMTLNLAIEKAKGNYIVFVGSDDVLYPDALENQIREFEKNSDLAFVYGKCRCIDQNGELSGEVLGENAGNSALSMDEVIASNGIPAVTVMARKDCLESVGLYDKHLIFSDWHLWIKLLAHYEMAFIDRFICKYRIHDKNTSIGISSEKYFVNSREVMISLIDKKDEIGGRLSSKGKALAASLKVINQHLANSYIDGYMEQAEKGNLQRAFSYLSKAAKIYPLIFLSFRRTLAIIKKGLIGVAIDKTSK